MWPFLGRDADVFTVRQMLGDSSVVLHGPAGVGKSRLARAVADDIATAGRIVAHVHANNGARPLPLLPLRPLIGDANPAQILDAVHRSVGLGPHAPGPGAPVVVIDDLHALDEQSAALLIRLLDAGRVRLLMTLRSAETITRPVAAILRHEGVRRREVTLLDEPSMELVISTALGAPADGRTTATLVRSAQGNPLLLRELIDGSLSSGTLVARNGLWTLTGSFSTTPVLSDVIGSRLRDLSQDERSALEYLVVGGALRLSYLASAVSFFAIEGLERQGIVTVTPPSEGRSADHAIVDVAHPLYRELLRAEIASLTRMRCSRRLAEIAAAEVQGTATTENESDVLQLAVWRLVGGAEIPPVETLHAARIAAARNDTELAAELAVAAYRSGPLAEAAILACWCLATNGRQAEAIAFADNAREHATEPSAIASLTLRCAEERWWWAHDLDGAQNLLLEGAASLEQPWSDLLRAQPSVFAALNGDAQEAIRIGSRYIDHELTWVRRVANIGLSLGLAMADRGAEAIAVADRGYQEAQTDTWRALSGDPAIHVASRLFASVQSDDVIGALTTARLVYDIARTQHAPQPRGWASMLLGMTLLAHGRPLAAARACTEGELLWADCQITGLARWCATIVALAHIDLGDLQAAQETADRMRTYDKRGFRFGDVHEARLEAAMTQATNQPEAATALLVQAATTAYERGSIIGVADCLQDLVRTGALTEARSVATLLPESPGPLTALRVRLVEAASNNDPLALEAIAETFLTFGRELSAAETFALASHAHSHHSNPLGAMRSALRCTEIAVACDHASAGVVEEVRPPTKLSRREHEVASLAAQGLSNRAVAEQLVVSERTVESHLYRVFAKLGISSREELRRHL